MCPSVAVLGGGGNGGGGSGNGAGDGNGNGPGDGDGSGDNAQSDGTGSGACGTGGAGACSNCGHNVAVGDPVDVVSGKVFTVPVRELRLPGTFTLTWLRSYGADNRRVDVGMGFGWSHSLGWRLEEHRDHVLVRSGDGSRTVMPLPRPGEQVRLGGWGILRADEFYVVRPGNEFIHYFERQPGSDYFRLAFVKYRNRGVISLQYEGTRLARVIDSVGRVILLERGPNDRVASIALPDARGNTIVFARYGYDSEGNLVTAADADGAVTTYAYDDDHRLVRLQYPSGLTFHFRYDANGRCIETWGEGPDLPAALAQDLPATLVDGSVARGIFHCKLDFGVDGYSEVVDSTRLRRFFGGPGDAVAKAVDPRGGVTTREFDDAGRVVSQTDPNGSKWLYWYDDVDEIIREIDPEGREVTLRRDGAGRVVEMVDAAKGVVRVDRDDSGEIVAIHDQAGATKRFVRDARGLVVECHDQRGARHVYEYDTHANCIAKRSVRGGVSRASYDSWGRLLQETDALGFSRSYTYSNGGKLLTGRDRSGGITSFTYDKMGNCTSQTEPDGTTTSWEFGGLNWCILERLATGDETRIQYNREGFATRLVNARGQTYELERDPIGHIASETNFFGQRIRFGYDATSRVVWYDEGSGKHVLERDQVGNVISHTAPDGASRTFEYSPRNELVSAKNGKTSFRWTLDPVGRVLREELTVDEVTYTVESEFDSTGDRVGVRTSLGHRLLFRRDVAGQVMSAMDARGDVVSVRRNEIGLAVESNLSAGGTIKDTYDPSRRLRRREVLPANHRPAAGAGEPDWIGGTAPGVSDHQFDYGVNEELVSVRGTSDVDYEYDLLKHLRKARRNGRVSEFRSDPNGNHHEVGSSALARHYDDGDRLLSLGATKYVYDARGRLVEESTTEGGKTSTKRFAWDDFGMLRTVEKPDGSKVEFEYDAFARRLAKRVTRRGKRAQTQHYVWDLVSMVHEVSARKAAPDVRTYLFLDNDDVRPLGHRDAVAETSGDWRFYVTDPLGTPEAIVDGGGRTLSKAERDVFGVTTFTGTERTPFRYPGQQADDETGLHYNRFRTYDPVTGRYLSADPIALEAGTNLYAYARNPVGWMDPLGLHDLTHSSDDPGFNRTQGRTMQRGPHAGETIYRSGRNPNMPAQLACTEGMDARTHTEQQFAHDLISQRGNRRGAHTTHNLVGTFPPCPTCHGAMMRAARETGATINYSWTQNGATQTIEYTGSGARARSGELARRLAGDGTNPGVYDHTLRNQWGGINQPGDGGQTYTSDSRQYWGFNSSSSCEAEYQDMRDARKAGGTYNPSTPTARRPNPR